MLELRDALGQVGGVDNSRTQCRTCMHACNRNGRKRMVTLVFSHVPNMLEETKKGKENSAKLCPTARDVARTCPDYISYY